MFRFFPMFANVVYPLAKQAILDKLLDMNSDDIRAYLIDPASYTYNAAHDFLDDVPGGARVAGPVALTTKTIALGVFDADDVTFTSVTNGANCGAVLIYSHDGGADSARRLILYIDTGVGLPFTGNGGNVTVSWDNGANRIFSI